jgi:YebC/PmpR family DNA-binding regulatory protein
MTDNKNRALGEVRNILERHGGNLGASGSVAWMFKKKGSITYDKYAMDEEKLTMAAIDAGAEDVLSEETVFEVVTTPENFIKVRDALKSQGFTSLNAEVTLVPANTVKLGGEEANKVLKLVNLLEELDDVQSVHANFDIPDALIEQLSK